MNAFKSFLLWKEILYSLYNRILLSTAGNHSNSCTQISIQSDMSPSDKKQKHPHHKKAMREKQKNLNFANSKKKGKKNGFRGKRKISKVDKEIKEIEAIHKRLAEINALEEEERRKIVRFDALPISNYTKQGTYIVVLPFVGLREAGFVEMTDIQRSSLLNALNGYTFLFNSN